MGERNCILFELQYVDGETEKPLNNNRNSNSLFLWSVLYAQHHVCVCVLSRFSSVQSLQSCPNLCDPIDCSLPGSSVHGILQARVLEWVATPSSRGSSRPRDRTLASFGSCVAGESSITEPLGKPAQHHSSVLCVSACLILMVASEVGTIYCPHFTERGTRALRG